MTTASPELTVLEFSPIRGGQKTRIETELQKLDDGQQPQPGQHCFRIMNENGDDRLVWDAGSIREINAARRAFVDLVKKNMTPYKVGVGGNASSEVMETFDPAAEEVIFLDTQLVAGG